MTYALVKDGILVKYPYSFGLLRADNPNTSYPSDVTDERLAEFGVHKVFPIDKPVFDQITQNVVEGNPVFSGIQWEQSWIVESATPEEIAKRQEAELEKNYNNEVKLDSFVSSFILMTPTQIATYVENNTANLTTTRALLKKMAMMLFILAREKFKE